MTCVSLSLFLSICLYISLSFAACATPAEVDGIYSTSLETAEIDRITAAHPTSKATAAPLFIYMALHSVHGPNEDPWPLVDVNETFGEVVAYDRRIFAVRNYLLLEYSTTLYYTIVLQYIDIVRG